MTDPLNPREASKTAPPPTARPFRDTHDHETQRATNVSALAEQLIGDSLTRDSDAFVQSCPPRCSSPFAPSF